MPPKPKVLDNRINSRAGASDAKSGAASAAAHRQQTAAEPPGASAPDHAELARSLRAQLATVTGGLAPEVYANAWWDWYLQLARQPPRQVQLMQDAMSRALDTWGFAMRAATGQPLPPDHADERYGGEAWARWPFNVYARSYRNYVDWWQSALSGVKGVAPETERTLDFVGRNALEAASPANYLLTNPELLEAHARRTGR